MTGIERIAAERKRQIEEEGFTAEEDDMLDDELAMAAMCYALPKDFEYSHDFICFWWPFCDDYTPTPNNRIRELEKTGALIAAEIDRLIRLENGRIVKHET